MINRLLRTITGCLFLVLASTGCSNDSAPRDQVALSTDDKAGDTMTHDQQLLDLPLEVDIDMVEDIRQRDDVILIDVREPSEYDAGHIPGVNLIPLGQVAERISEIPTDKTVVVVCRSGNRSGQATGFLRQQGLDNVHNMQGGMLAWEAKGYVVEK